MSIKVKFDSAQIKTYLQKKINQLADKKDIFTNFGIFLVSSTQLRFKSSRAPDGSFWKKSFRAKLKGGQTLLETGRLRNSIQYNASGDNLFIGTNVKYAPTHQFGARITPKTANALKFIGANGGFVTSQEVNVPKRPFLGVSNSDVKELNEIAKTILENE